MTKVLRKAITERSELENKYVKNETNENLKTCVCYFSLFLKEKCISLLF